MFKWLAAEQLVPAAIYQSLHVVDGLRKGRTAAHETEPIRPVSDAVIEATLPHLPPVVADMVRFQRYGRFGSRPLLQVWRHHKRLRNANRRTGDYSPATIVGTTRRHSQGMSEREARSIVTSH